MKILHVVGTRPNFMKAAPITSTTLHFDRLSTSDNLRTRLSTSMREMEMEGGGWRMEGQRGE